jgi:hypothetical protein
VHRKHYRRVIECRDGLVRISPYLNDPSGDLSGQLKRALQAHAEGVPVSTEAKPLAAPAADGLDADVRELELLSQSLQTR